MYKLHTLDCEKNYCLDPDPDPDPSFKKRNYWIRIRIRIKIRWIHITEFKAVVTSLQFCWYVDFKAPIQLKKHIISHLQWIYASITTLFLRGENDLFDILFYSSVVTCQYHLVEPTNEWCLFSHQWKMYIIRADIKLWSLTK